MADWNDTRQRTNWSSVPRAGDAVARRETYDAGLRSYMLSIYNYMASGVLLTGIVALLTAQSGLAVTFAHRSADVDRGAVAAGHRLRDELRHEQVLQDRAPGDVSGASRS